MPLPHHETQIRVRYQETDAQGHVHHANYLTYFEQGRVELMRSLGRDYREMEAVGLMLVVVEFHCKYYRGAQFDQLLRLVTRVQRVKGVRIEHAYQLFHEDQLLVEATSVVACIDRQGKVKPLPDWVRDISLGEPVIVSREDDKTLEVEENGQPNL